MGLTDLSMQEKRKMREQFYKTMRGNYKQLGEKVKSLAGTLPKRESFDFCALFAEYGKPIKTAEPIVYDPLQNTYPDWWKATYLQRNTINAHEFMAEHIKNGGGLTEDFIKDLHKKFYADYDPLEYLKRSGGSRNSLGDNLVEPGEYRKDGGMGAWESTIFDVDVSHEDTELVLFSEPSEISEKMKEFVAKHTKSKGEPMVNAAKMYGDFIAIHPFDDGNGRMARALINFELMRSGLQPIHTKGAELNGYSLAKCSVDYRTTKDPAAMAAVIANCEVNELNKVLERGGISSALEQSIASNSAAKKQNLVGAMLDRVKRTLQTVVKGKDVLPNQEAIIKNNASSSRGAV